MKLSGRLFIRQNKNRNCLRKNLTFTGSLSQEWEISAGKINLNNPEILKLLTQVLLNP